MLFTTNVVLWDCPECGAENEDTRYVWVICDRCGGVCDTVTGHEPDKSPCTALKTIHLLANQALEEDDILRTDRLIKAMRYIAGKTYPALEPE